MARGYKYMFFRMKESRLDLLFWGSSESHRVCVQHSTFAEEDCERSCAVRLSQAVEREIRFACSVSRKWLLLLRVG